MDAATRTLIKRAISDNKRAKLKREGRVNPTRRYSEEKKKHHREKANATRNASKIADFANQHLYPVVPTDPLSDLVCNECGRITPRRYAHNRHYFDCKYRRRNHHKQ